MEWWWKWKPKNLVVAQTSQLPWDSTTTGSINIHLHEIENWCCCDPRQPIDKGINKQFKTEIRTQYQEWMVNGQFIYPPSGREVISQQGTGFAVDKLSMEGNYNRVGCTILQVL